MAVLWWYIIHVKILINRNHSDTLRFKLITYICESQIHTFVGSIMPFSTMLTYSPFIASYPISGALCKIFSTTREPSTPAFLAIVIAGIRSALRMMSKPLQAKVKFGKLTEGYFLQDIWRMRSTLQSLPIFWSSLTGLMLSSAGMQRSRAHPPPRTIPSSTAARVAFSASVTRSFFSFTSTSLVPPT